MNTKLILIILIIGAIIGTIIINVTGSSDDEGEQSAQDQTTFTQNTVTEEFVDEQGNVTTTKEATITITESGYSPQNIEIEQGTTVVFENESGPDRWPASNNHPTHLIYPEFDPKKKVPAGSSWSFTFDKVGDWGYHDHIQDDITGTIRVVEKISEQQGTGSEEETYLPTEPDNATQSDLPQESENS